MKLLPIFKLPKMTKQEIWKLIRRQRLCRIAFKGKDYPYLAPFQYVVLNGILYFHFTDYGTKMKLIENIPVSPWISEIGDPFQMIILFPEAISY